MSTPPAKSSDASTPRDAGDDPVDAPAHAPASPADEALVSAVARVARDERTRAREAMTPKLMALTEGALSPAEVEALEAELAAMSEMEPVLDAFRPMDDAARARTTAMILRDFKPARAPAAANGGDPPAPNVARRRLGRAATLVSSLAVAAGVLLAIGALRSARTLPDYELTLSGEQPMRGESDAAVGPRDIHRFSAHERFRVLLRPERAFDGPVAARVFLVRGNEARIWQTPVDVSNEGAIRIVTPLDTLPAGSTGEWEMVIVVSRPDALPDAPPAAGADSRAMHVLRARVVFEGL